MAGIEAAEEVRWRGSNAPPSSTVEPPMAALFGLLNPQQFQSSSPTRGRTGTPLRARDFKFDKGDSSRREPCDSAGSDDVSQRLDRGVAFTDPVVAFSADVPEDYFDTSTLLPSSAEDENTLTHEQVAALLCSLARW